MKSGLRLGVAAAAVLAVAFVGGCSTPIKSTEIAYAYDPRVSFPELKTYRWADARQTYRLDPLLETNVRFLADRDLQAKGLTLKGDKTDLLIWIAYDAGSYGYGYELRMLTLNISRADNNELVWRGTATGAIKTDATSGDLKKTVEGMLVNFPPK